MLPLTSCMVPLESFLPLRKAILSMKDNNFFLCVKLFEKHIEVSVLDAFQCTYMYVLIPVCRTEGMCDGSVHAWVPAKDLLKLANVLKSYQHPITMSFSSDTRSLIIFQTNNQKPLLRKHDLFPLDVVKEHFIQPVSPNKYYWIPFLSQALLDILVDGCPASPVMQIALQFDATLIFRQVFDCGETSFEKKLNERVKKEWSHLDPTTEPQTIIAKGTCIIKFVKQIVNSMVNCSKKTCVFGIPLMETDPIVIQFLLVRPNIYEYFMMLPYSEPLPHTSHANAPHQNPLHLRCAPRTEAKAHLLKQKE